MDAPLGRYSLVALDAENHVALAEFYRAIVGGELQPLIADWIELHTSGGVLAFQHAPGHRPPTWPDGERPQQAHLDIDVDDLAGAEAAVIERGAVKTTVQPSPDKWRVFLDPAGHPFCLVLNPS